MNVFGQTNFTSFDWAIVIVYLLGSVVIGVYVFYWGLYYSGGEDIWDYMAVSG